MNKSFCCCSTGLLHYYVHCTWLVYTINNHLDESFRQLFEQRTRFVPGLASSFQMYFKHGQGAGYVDDLKSALPYWHSSFHSLWHMAHCGHMHHTRKDVSCEQPWVCEINRIMTANLHSTRAPCPHAWTRCTALLSGTLSVSKNKESRRTAVCEKMEEVLRYPETNSLTLEEAFSKIFYG